MKQSRLRSLCWAALSALLTCVPEQGALYASSEMADVENVEWTLTELDGAAIAPTERGAPTLKLSSKERRASGFAGCNRYTGGYELNGATLRFGALAATRMACPDPTPETALLKVLEATASWKVAGRTLELSDASATVRARWTVRSIESGDKP
jgi:heat shock protein HslJ